jgi:hypothetical protein
MPRGWSRLPIFTGQRLSRGPDRALGLPERNSASRTELAQMQSHRTLAADRVGLVCYVSAETFCAIALGVSAETPGHAATSTCAKLALILAA